MIPAIVGSALINVSETYFSKGKTAIVLFMSFSPPASSLYFCLEMGCLTGVFAYSF